jgi:hypothetical protein
LKVSAFLPNSVPQQPWTSWIAVPLIGSPLSDEDVYEIVAEQEKRIVKDAIVKGRLERDAAIQYIVASTDPVVPSNKRTL